MSAFDGTVPPIRKGEFIFGARPHINGPRAEPSGVVVTRHELEEVARYWCGEDLHNCFKCFVSQQFGNYERRLHLYSVARLKEIEQVIGKDRLATIVYEAVLNFQKECNVGDEDWRIFTSGTAEERADWLAVNGVRADFAEEAEMKER